MKVQASGILILIACILTGCGKSMQDVAGVYETAEIKEPQSSGSYYSTTWVLDLAESGTFTLKENKLRKFREGKTHEPVPIDGSEISGKWEFDRDSIVCNWSGKKSFHLTLTLDIQSTGSLVSGTIGVPDVEVARKIVSEDDLYFLHFNYPYGFNNLRFKRVE